MREIGSDNLKAMLMAIAGRIADSRERLNRLDAALGDGDHGASISAAFAKAALRSRACPTPSRARSG